MDIGQQVFVAVYIDGSGGAVPYFRADSAVVVGVDDEAGVIVRKHGRIDSYSQSQVFETLQEAKRHLADRLRRSLVLTVEKFEKEIKKLEADRVSVA